jgi:hypothetical protein
MWRILCESVEGTSHRLNGTLCQDSSFATTFSCGADDGVILVCADGAGSATESKAGSELACRVAVARVLTFLEAGRGVEEITEDSLRACFADVHAELAQDAERRSIPLRELACTLLLAVVGRSAAAFAQVGDGAIVVNSEGPFQHIFWPQTGEYQNTTFFITDPTYAQHVQCTTNRCNIKDVSLLSDGLQMLALDYTNRNVHQPFFADLFRALRLIEDHHDLVSPMRQWLDSEKVNARTDDDKTLILATRATTSVDSGV